MNENRHELALSDKFRSWLFLRNCIKREMAATSETWDSEGAFLLSHSHRLLPDDFKRARKEVKAEKISQKILSERRRWLKSDVHSIRSTHPPTMHKARGGPSEKTLRVPCFLWFSRISPPCKEKKNKRPLEQKKFRKCRCLSSYGANIGSCPFSHPRVYIVLVYGTMSTCDEGPNTFERGKRPLWHFTQLLSPPPPLSLSREREKGLWLLRMWAKFKSGIFSKTLTLLPFPQFLSLLSFLLVSK